MQRVFANFLFGLYLLSAVVPMPVKEVFAKLPALVEHYGEHVKEDPQTGVFEFFALHYGDDFARHRSEHNHDNLPGKDGNHHHTGACVCAAFALPVPAPVLALTPPLPQSSDKAALFAEQNLRPSSHLASIWQPPRV